MEYSSKAERNAAHLKEAHQALKLSWGEKISMFFSRSIIGGIAGTLLFTPLKNIFIGFLPHVSDKVHETTQGQLLAEKNGMKIYAPAEKSLGHINKINTKAQQLFDNPTRCAMVSSAVITVGIGAILTARSIVHYNKGAKFLEQLYAEQLENTPLNQAVPTPPTRDDLRNLDKWRAHAKRGQRERELRDVTGAAEVAATLSGVGF